MKYTVKKGDSLYKIAKDHGCSIAQIIALNKIANANLIKVGEVLTLPDAGNGEKTVHYIELGKAIEKCLTDIQTLGSFKKVMEMLK